MSSEWQGTLGAIPVGEDVHFRVWAPKRESLELRIWSHNRDWPVPMERDGDDWVARVPGIGAGARYGYVIGGHEFPDPCSRRQPDGVHGLSEVVDPSAFEWSDQGWQPPALEDLVIYEMHVGTFSPLGTFDGAIEELRRLVDLGVTAVEVMPIASFPGRWNWGYDGVDLFAPAEVYGGPDGFRRFVNAAHAAGLAVILDVVYNHFGPDGNYTAQYSDQYLTARHQTPWGDAINYDDVGAEGVRRHVRENMLHWVHEYHVDGFRFDATHAIKDDSPQHILAELSQAARSHPRVGHVPYLIAESNENEVRYLKPTWEGGYGFDAIWADDFHHAVRLMMTRGREGYLASYTGATEELVQTIVHGLLYEGQDDPVMGGPRGTRAREQPWRQFVFAIQNHDQVGNQALGLRLNHLASLGDYLAASTLLLALPQTPLLFEGQEFMASTPFLYFTDHNPELGRMVTEGRREEFAGFRAFQDPAMREQIPDPQSPATFRHSVLRQEEIEYGAGALCLAYYREMLRLRREDPVLVSARRGRPEIQAWYEGKAIVVQLATAEGRRWIAVNFGDEERVPVEGPDHDWQAIISSDDVRYGGAGAAPAVSGGGLIVPPHSGALLR